MILTIITPVFNGASYLRSCVENVSEQWQEGIEHWIIDGGSQDGSLEILKELASKHPQLKFISEKDKGQSDAMNKGIRLAAGKWIGFLNVDDFYEPGALKKVIQQIHEVKEQEVILVGILKIIDAEGKVLKMNKPNEMGLARIMADTCEWPYNPAAYFYPSKIHEKIGYFPINEHFAMDYDFILKAWVNHISFKFVPEIWGNFRLLPEAKTSQDQQGNQSYLRSQALRDFYFRKLTFGEKGAVLIEKLRWWAVLKWRKFFPVNDDEHLSTI